MGRSSSVRRQQTAPLTFLQRLDLRCGSVERIRAFTSDAERRGAWERHREVLLQSMPAGMRPAAWWDYEAPEPCACLRK